MPELTPEQKRVKIAEACGWNHCRLEGSGHLRGPSGVHPLNKKFGDAEHAFWVLPDYLNDLNAMAQAESTLRTGAEQNKYILEIAEICWADQERETNQVVFNQLTATASQRADAFLKVKGIL